MVLAVVAILILLGGAIIFTRSDSTGTDEDSATAKLSSKSNPRRAPGPSSERSDGKSDGKTDEERFRHLSPEEFQKVVANISANAREELTMLREKYATEYEDQQVREQFAAQLVSITDPTERQKVLRERSELMKKARQRAEASKTPQDRRREKELQVLIQVDNLNRMSQYVAQNPSLTEEARDFDTKLVQWVRDHEGMNPAAFHQSFNKLRAEVTALRVRHSEQRKAGLVK